MTRIQRAFSKGWRKDTRLGCCGCWNRISDENEKHKEWTSKAIFEKISNIRKIYKNTVQRFCSTENLNVHQEKVNY
jgi:hypothetical protein